MMDEDTARVIFNSMTTSPSNPTPAASAPVPTRGRYIMYKLLRRFLELKPVDQHECLVNAEFTVEESIKLCKAFNGLKYHRLRRRQANYLTLPKEF